MDPIQYIPQNSDFGNGLLEALKLSAASQQLQAQRQQRIEEEQYKADLMGALQSKDPSDLVKLSAKYPKHGEGLKQAWSMLGAEQQKAELGAAQQTWYAINSGRPDVALGVLDRQIEGLKNAGKDVAKLTALREAIQLDPQTAAQSIGFFISSIAPKDFAENFKKLNEDRRAQEEQPGKLAKLGAEARKTGAEADTAAVAARYAEPRISAEAKKAAAEAESAAVKARFAESSEVSRLKKEGWETTKLQEDIKIAKLNAQIAAANVAVGREGNAIKREQLQMERDKLAQKRDDEVRARASAVDSARLGMDNMLNTVDRVLANPSLNSVLGSIEGAKHYPNTLMGTVSPFGSGDERADAIALIDTLKSQAFLAMVPTFKESGGAGALSDAEGAKLESALTNLSRKQSEKQFRENLTEAQRLILKGRKNLTRKYGVPESVPDTPAAGTGATSNVDALLKKYAP